MNKFGGWAIQESCYNLIREILPEGKTILEMGSGHGTDALSKHYNMIGPKLESLSYDLILVDGPNGAIGRGGFLKHLDLFNTNVPIIFDDINRKDELQMMVKVSEILNKPCKKLDKHTGYIL